MRQGRHDPDSEFDSGVDRIEDRPDYDGSVHEEAASAIIVSLDKDLANAHDESSLAGRAGRSFRIETEHRVDDPDGAIEKIGSHSFEIVVVKCLRSREELVEGVDLCKRLRTRNASVPIVMLIADESAHDLARVELAEISGVTFSRDCTAGELIDIVDDCLRRSAILEPTVIDVGPIQFQPGLKRFRRLNGWRDLTASETKLLHVMTVMEKEFMTDEEILRGFFGHVPEPHEANIHGKISELQKKVELDPENPEILVIQRDGFRLVRN